MQARASTPVQLQTNTYPEFPVRRTGVDARAYIFLSGFS
jgi:hypothetical protein